jgi:hypothetical protein
MKEKYSLKKSYEKENQVRQLKQQVIMPEEDQ